MTMRTVPLMEMAGVDRLEQELRLGIRQGRMPVGGRLMPIRQLASGYGLSYGQVQRVVKRLEREGLLTSRQGGGTFVSDGRAAAMAAPALRPVDRQASLSVQVLTPLHFLQNASKRPWVLTVLRGFEAEMQARGQTIRLSYGETLADLPVTNDRQVYLVFQPLAEAEQRRLDRRFAVGEAIFLFDHQPADYRHGLCLQTDAEWGIRQGLDQLYARGHRRIAFWGWEETDAVLGWMWWVAERRQTYESWLQEHPDCGRAESYTLPIPHSPETASQESAAAEFLRQSAASAVIAANDSIASLLLTAAAATGRQVPRDVAVLGVDDDWPSLGLNLSTVRRPLTEMGQLAATLALASIHGAGPPQGLVRVRPSLIIRGSIEA